MTALAAVWKQDEEAVEWHAIDRSLAGVQAHLAEAALRLHLEAIRQLGTVLRRDKNVDDALRVAYAVLYRGLIRVGREVFPRIVRHGWEQGIRQMRRMPVSRSYPGAPVVKGVSAMFNLAWAQVAQFIAERPREYARPASATTIDSFRRVLVAGLEQGLSIDQMVRQIVRQQLPEISRRRATGIARTEVIGASNRGALASYQASRVVEQKKWLWTRDTRTRDSHKINQVVPLNEPFVLPTGARLLHPGDTSLGAPIQEIVLCRCALRPMVRRAEDKPRAVREEPFRLFPQSLPDDVLPNIPYGEDIGRNADKVMAWEKTTNVLSETDKSLFSDYLRQWGNDSDSDAGLLLKAMVQEKTGSKIVFSKHSEGMRKVILDQFTPDRQTAAKEGLGVLYEVTQKSFRDAGVKKVTLYRGMRISISDVDVSVGSVKEIIQNPVSSWTSFEAEARIFAKYEKQPGQVGLVLKAEVPVEQVLGHPSVLSGLSGVSRGTIFVSEDEWLVMETAKKLQATVVQVFAAKQKKSEDRPLIVDDAVNMDWLHRKKKRRK